MKGSTEAKTLNFAGPWWFFQLWLISTFETKLNFHITPVHDDEVNRWEIEGFRLAHLTTKTTDHSSIDDFLEYYDVFSIYDTFESSMSPFVGRKLGPKWFQMEFLTNETKYLENNVEV